MEIEERIETYFDALSEAYDQDFSASMTGKAQRDRVWEWLSDNVLNKGARQILELNGGTGVDAEWLHHQGHRVLFTEPSAGMMQQARRRLEPLGINCLPLGFEEMDQVPADSQPNLVFSNFGGLNCISPSQVRKFFQDLDERLAPGADVVLVFMPRYCLWETLAFGLKGSASAFRRWSGKTKASGSAFPVWYFRRFELEQLAPKNWQLQHSHAIGLAIPGAFLESAYARNPWFRKTCEALENLLSPLPFLGDFSDHVLMHFRKRSA